MVYSITHAPHAVEDLRDEFRLSRQDTEHVQWLLIGGLLSPADIRTMLARISVYTLAERYGEDTDAWPTFANVSLSVPHRK